jgi:hypothetical protein
MVGHLELDGLVAALEAEAHRLQGVVEGLCGLIVGGTVEDQFQTDSRHDDIEGCQCRRAQAQDKLVGGDGGTL